MTSGVRMPTQTRDPRAAPDRPLETEYRPRVAIDARRAIDMFAKLKTPVLGLVENMSAYVCPNCGHEAHLFGHGGVAVLLVQGDRDG